MVLFECVVVAPAASSRPAVLSADSHGELDWLWKHVRSGEAGGDGYQSGERPDGYPH